MGLILGSPRPSLKVVVVVLVVLVTVMVVVMRVVSQTQALSLGSTALLHAVHLPCPQIPRYLGHELCHELNLGHCGHVLSHIPSLLGIWVPSTVPLCVLAHPLNGHTGQVQAVWQTRELTTVNTNSPIFTNMLFHGWINTYCSLPSTEGKYQKAAHSLQRNTVRVMIAEYIKRTPQCKVKMHHNHNHYRLKDILVPTTTALTYLKSYIK